MLRIVDWNKFYENNRSRVISDLRWVPIPNRHDGEGYATVMGHEHAPIVFTVFILLLQIASKRNPRGCLVRSDGTPLTFESMALATRAKVEWFKVAVPILKQVGWVEEADENPARNATNPAGNVTRTSPERQSSDVLENTPIKANNIKHLQPTSPERHPTDAQVLRRKEGMEGREGTGDFPPSYEEFKKYGAGVGIAESDCRACFDYYNAAGFMRGNTPLRGYASLLARWKANGTSFRQSVKEEHPKRKVNKLDMTIDAGKVVGL